MKLKTNAYLIPLKVIASTLLLILFLLGYFLINKQLSKESLKFTDQYPQQDLIFNHYIILKGEIQKPGVYEFSNNEKLTSVIERAGGLKDNIKLDSITTEKQLTFDKDGSKEFLIYSENYSKSTADNIDNLINVNSATKEELISLPGIGNATAESIINSRPFSSLEDLLDVKGIGEKKFEKIKDLVSL